jgi:protein-S-isoprenylcysteine O-methyltransferase Ste14
MQELTFFNTLLLAFFLLAVVVFVALFFVAAPYGRHARQGWGYSVGSRLGWVLMEAPSPLAFGICFLLAGGAGVTGLIFLLMWEAHYIHRAFIYPFSLRGAARRMPLSVVSFAIVFNLMNGYLNGRYIFTFSGGYGAEWLTDPRFLIGVAMFVAGYVINRRADQALREMRANGESGYVVCHRGLFRQVSCPNYLGEIIIWTGWAVATWSLPGLAFAVWTLANLLPRARANHKWYRKNFPDYPPERKALVPGLW